MDPILPLIERSERTPPQSLDGAVRTTPFFEVGQKEFLLRTPSGGRMHYAPGLGIAVSEPSGRPAGDLQPFVMTTGFAAAAWMEGFVPLSTNAVQLPDGEVMLVAHGMEEVREALAVALHEAAGLTLADAPVAINPEDPKQIATNGQSITLRNVWNDRTRPPVRQGARRLATDLPALDGLRVHRCAGLLSIAEGGPGAGAGGLERLSMMEAITQIRNCVFMPLVGTAIWGQETIGTANMVLAGNLPMLRFTLPKNTKISTGLAADLLSQLVEPEAG